MTHAASVLGVEVTPAMVHAARALVSQAKSVGASPALPSTWPASTSPDLAPLLAAADVLPTPGPFAVLLLLGSPCAACGWPIEDGAPSTIRDGAHVHPECAHTTTKGSAT